MVSLRSLAYVLLFAVLWPCAAAAFASPSQVSAHYASVRPPSYPTPQQKARGQKQRENDKEGGFRVWIEKYNTVIDLTLTIVLVSFTGILAASTWSLWATTSKVANAAEKSAQTAADAFTNLERPYVYIYGVSRFEKLRSRPMNEGPIVNYSVANWGKTPATIGRIKAGISTHSDGPLDPLVIDYRDELHTKLLRSPILRANKERHNIGIIAPDGIDFAMPNDEIEPVLKPGESAYVWVIIEYSGPFTEAMWPPSAGAGTAILSASSAPEIPNTPTWNSAAAKTPAKRGRRR